MEQDTEKRNAENELVKKSLKWSVYDGIFYFLMVGCGESFFLPLAVYFQADSYQIGLLASLPLVLGSFAQLGANRMLKIISSRKNFVSWGALLQGISFLPIVLLIWLPVEKTNWLLFFVCLYFIAGMIIVPVWSGWMGDLVPELERGRYFGHRNRITGLFTLVSLILSGTLLHLFESNPANRPFGFALLFMAAFVFRYFSFTNLRKKWDPPLDLKGKPTLGLRQILKSPVYGHFRWLVIYLGAVHFAAYIASPFFIPYMLRDLEMNYITFTLVQATIILFKYMSMPFWGKFSDKYGSKKVLLMGCFLLPLLPLFWLHRGSTGYFLCIQALSGFAWAAFELSSFNLVLDNAPREARVAGIAYLNALNGLGLLVGALLGAEIIEWQPLFSNGYLSVFFVSGIARYMMMFLFMKKIREFREVEYISYKNLIFRPFASISIRGLMFQMPWRKKNGKGES